MASVVSFKPNAGGCSAVISPADEGTVDVYVRMAGFKERGCV